MYELVQRECGRRMCWVSFNRRSVQRAGGEPAHTMCHLWRAKKTALATASAKLHLSATAARRRRFFLHKRALASALELTCARRSRYLRDSGAPKALTATRYGRVQRPPEAYATRWICDAVARRSRSAQSVLRAAGSARSAGVSGRSLRGSGRVIM